MGSGLATTAQLEAFRRSLAGGDGSKDNGCASVWMSATLRPDWLTTVDFKGRIDDQGRIDGKTTLSLSNEDRKNDQVAARWNAEKPLLKAESETDDPTALAAEVRRAHKPGTRTIVVANTVKRACALFDALSKARPAAKGGGGRKEKGAAVSAATAATPAARPSAAPNLVLLHSRFRPPDRAKRVAEALADVDPNGGGTIVISTQVIEAGVDVSATTLFTELAPWASLVQRFGRCNRRGEQNEQASVRWIDLPAMDADAEKVRHPYELPDLRAAARELEKLKDVGLGSLASFRQRLDEKRLKALFPHQHTHVIRRKDLLDLFDTTPDLAGNDIDIDRYVREVDETDVRVFWRNYGDPRKGATPNDNSGEGQTGGERRVESAPRRDELCPVPIGDFKTYAKSHPGRVWRWNFTEKFWEHADPNAIVPGQVLLTHVTAGGYSSERGWSGDSDDVPTLEWVPSVQESQPPDANEEDPQAGEWQELDKHTDAVCKELDCVLGFLSLRDDEAGALQHAARWHDRGKAHPVFQSGLPDDCPDASKIWAKGSGDWKKYRRVLNGGREISVRHFRHELASALAVLDPRNKAVPDDLRDLVAYLIAAHHGKVRVSIRSMPNEVKPRREAGLPQRRFARGVWDGDGLPSVSLGGGVNAPAVTLSLEPMELGLCETEPFTGQPSWIERVLRLRDWFGPFRLAYLEALLRAADARASAAAAATSSGDKMPTTGPSAAGREADRA
jgi:CRISPR-associated endonuclease/helicase Cas3